MQVEKCKSNSYRSFKILLNVNLSQFGVFSPLKYFSECVCKEMYWVRPLSPDEQQCLCWTPTGQKQQKGGRRQREKEKGKKKCISFICLESCLSQVLWQIQGVTEPLKVPSYPQESRQELLSRFLPPECLAVSHHDLPWGQKAVS